jgi:hypothetical protein
LFCHRWKNNNPGYCILFDGTKKKEQSYHIHFFKKKNKRQICAIMSEDKLLVNYRQLSSVPVYVS